VGASLYFNGAQLASGGGITLSSALTGFVLGTDGTALTATDTVLQAFQKLQVKVNAASGGGTAGGSYSTTIGDGVSTQFDVTHALTTKDVSVSVFEATGSFRKVDFGIEIQYLSTTVVRLIFDTVVASGAYRVVVMSASGTPATVTGATTANPLTLGAGMTGSTFDGSAAATHAVSANALTRTLNFVIDGGGTVIMSGAKGCVTIDFDCTIVSWDIFSDVVGTITVDVSKAAYAAFPTGTASGGTSPALSNLQKNTASINWTGFTTITAGDVLMFSVNGNPVSSTRVTVALKLLAT
jgi:hypothetical protein